MYISQPPFVFVLPFLGVQFNFPRESSDRFMGSSLKFVSDSDFHLKDARRIRLVDFGGEVEE